MSELFFDQGLVVGTELFGTLRKMGLVTDKEYRDACHTYMRCALLREEEMIDLKTIEAKEEEYMAMQSFVLRDLLIQTFVKLGLCRGKFVWNPEEQSDRLV